MCIVLCFQGLILCVVVGGSSAFLVISYFLFAGSYSSIQASHLLKGCVFDQNLNDQVEDQKIALYFTVVAIIGLAEK